MGNAGWAKQILMDAFQYQNDYEMAEFDQYMSGLLITLDLRIFSSSPKISEAPTVLKVSRTERVTETTPLPKTVRQSLDSSNDVKALQSEVRNIRSVPKGTGKAPGYSGKLPSQGTVDAGVPGAPKVDAGKQGKHVPGHGNNVSTKTQWPEGQNGVQLTQEAWVNGTPVKPDGSVRVYDFGKPVGPNGETRVKVHIDSKGNIHGYPVP
ncbi:hypothetical protein [Paenibacillus durus]|uniref:hypothetical protein n=1 Tax=Paenibacillus durus TaxID=44251 RepID=UPI0012DBF9B3|nr:hypothetical protein [Paenibacillus durus]